MDDLKGRVALVTGAGRGVGRVLAEGFGARGARVAANDISPVNLDGVVESINASGGEARAFVQDVSKKFAVQTLVNAVTDVWGKIDILVNAANVEPTFPLLEMDDWDWHRTLDVNLTGAFLMTQSVGRIMRAQGGGVIINVVPLAGRYEALDRAAYVASKMGLLGLTLQAARELESYGVRVHAIGTGLKGLGYARSVQADVMDVVLGLCDPEVLTGQIVEIA